MKFGELLAEIRAEKGWSQHKLAIEANTTQRHLSFLETGRSQAPREMVVRLGEALELPLDRRAEMFESAGFISPYKVRRVSDEEIQKTLAMIEKFYLANWPFPAMVLDATWNILRYNQAAKNFLNFEHQPGDAAPNLMEIFMRSGLPQRIRNWEQASTSLYLRIRRHARRTIGFDQYLEKAESSGLFDHALQRIADASELPIFIPFELEMPDGNILKFSSTEGNLSAVHDAVVEELIFEMFLPLDEASEVILRQFGAAS